MSHVDERMSIVTETEAEVGPDIVQNKRRCLMAKKRLCVALGVVLAGVLLGPSVPSVFHRWPELCCRYGDINIKTGQARYVRYLGFVKISEEVEDTPVSLALEGKTIDVADIKPWHRVHTSSPGVISPHYRFHGALHQANELNIISALNELDPDKKREIAEGILNLWQTEGSYFSVGPYLQTVFEKGMDISEQK